MREEARYAAAGALLLPGGLLISGCEHAPSINVLGSFFPAWLLCLTLGILLATGSRFLLPVVHLEGALSPSIVMYPCLTALFTFGLWLLFFH